MSDDDALDIFNEGGEIEGDHDQVNQEQFNEIDDLQDEDYEKVLDELVEQGDQIDNEPQQSRKRKKISSGESHESKQSKPRTSKRQINLEQISQKIREEVQLIKNQMDQIHQRDVKAIKNNKPALNKIKSIDEIIVKLSKQGVQREFVQEKGLDFLTVWLDKIPNGPEPSVSLRKKLLQFIYELNVKRSNLQGIRLGKVIYKLASKSEVKELRVLAGKVVEKWGKIVSSKEKDDDDDEDD